MKVIKCGSSGQFVLITGYNGHHTHITYHTDVDMGGWHSHTNGKVNFEKLLSEIRKVIFPVFQYVPKICFIVLQLVLSENFE